MGGAVERDVRGSRGSGFNPSLGPVRRVRLLKNYFIIIPMHVMIREIIQGRK